MIMTFEEEISAINQAYFFKEFTYSKITFIRFDGRWVAPIKKLPRRAALVNLVVL